jgi:prepilin-type N-terminal cleavage/methylation domain-containing protein
MNDCLAKIRHPKKQRFSRRRESSGFTLIEILLTTIILLIGLTAVFQTTRSALQRMATTRKLNEAQNACQAVLNELIARTAQIEPHEGRTVEHLPDWRIRVNIYPASQPGPQSECGNLGELLILGVLANYAILLRC